MTPATLPFIAPDGSSGDIPIERANDAMKAGFKPAVVMTAPDGSMGYIPRDRANDALKAGFRVGTPGAIREEQGAPKAGFLDTVGGFLKKGGQMAAGFMQAGAPGGATNLASIAMDTAEMGRRATEAAQQTPNDATDVERGAMIAGSLAGADTPALAENIKKRDVGGAIIESTPLVVAAAAPEVARRAGGIAESLKGKPSSLFTGKQPNVMASAAKLPPQAVSGAEDIFRASAPTGMNQGFRAQLYNAAGDLAEIGRKVALDEAKGGIVNPDMRVRATVNAISDHMQEMYQNEVAPQIAKAPNAQVSPQFGADAITGLKYLARNAGEEAGRNLASQALNGQLTLPQAYDLAKVVNAELRGFESMTPSERAASAATSRKLAGLKAADQALSQTINQTLRGLGESGIESFEKRYAALANVREQLSSRINATELNQPGVIKKIAKPVAGVFTGGKSGIASASQAAVADVNIGRMLQRGFQRLADSGITADRAVATQPQIKGLLPSGPIPLQQGEPIPGGSWNSVDPSMQWWNRKPSDALHP